MFVSGELLFRAAESSVSDLGEGGFAKNILLLALAEPSQGASQAFLSKVLAAANLDLQADALFAQLNAGQAINCFAGLAQRPKYIFVFGLPPFQVGLQANVQLYQPVELQGTTWVFADALSVLEPDRDKKGKLWGILKALFLATDHG